MHLPVQSILNYSIFMAVRSYEEFYSGEKKSQNKKPLKCYLKLLISLWPKMAYYFFVTIPNKQRFLSAFPCFEFYGSGSFHYNKPRSKSVFF